jgi:glycosyltransferase involved in cell wall biosynthesis
MLVSVIVPCYNQGKYLNESLESVFNQTYSDWECIIVDDGSTDGTNLIADQWVKKDDRFKYFYQDNNGVSSARNLGIKYAEGTYIQFLDSDDLLDKTKIEASLNQLIENVDLNIVITNFKMISSDSKTISEPFCKLNMELFTLDNFLYQWNKTFSIQVQCGFFDASLFQTIRFPENLSAQEDWVVWVELFKEKVKVSFIDKPLAYYRIHPTSRMMTLGIDDNQLKVLDNFKNILSKEEYHHFNKYLLSESYNSNLSLKLQMESIKLSNTYQTGLMIKKILKSIGLLKPARIVFKMILKLKAK